VAPRQSGEADQVGCRVEQGGNRGGVELAPLMRRRNNASRVCGKGPPGAIAGAASGANAAAISAG
jgi:hypothetical protein